MLNAEERALGRYRIGEGITGLVARTGRAEVVPDIRKDHRFLNRTRSRRKDEPLSFICVPLVHLGQVVGTLSVDRPIARGSQPLDSDLALLEVVANITAEAAEVFREECAERETLENENRKLRGMLAEAPGRLIGQCREMKAVYEQIRQVAPSDATVMIRGASGTGKELVARAIQNLSSRKGKPFVILNCAALPEALVESELFGHEKGAFTDARERRIGRVEAADGGTLFLDEIGSNEERRSDVRFIAATSRNLEELMSKKLFREDLYYRLCVFPIFLPELRRRQDDIMLLARHFLAKISARYGKSIDKFSAPVIGILQSYAWPGNVRELENCIERAVLTATDDCIRTYNLPAALQSAGFRDDELAPAGAMTLDQRLAATERSILEDALRRHNGNRSAAGRELGVSPRMMNYRLNRAGIQS